ncbi:hypothetical protein IAD21_06439 (plasmid) [Abditibacteriota bacterium]|nr:hypothetical protein IAD21_06439 [Abditibacteriota bacterium]
MIVTVASFKGGVGKTTSAVHLAALLSEKASTLLIDGDPNRSATGWSRRGELPFKVVDERQAARYVRDYEHIVIDTQARPSREDLEALADGCDLLILPSTPDALALDALLMTVEALHELGADKYRILLTMIPPKPSRDGEEAQSTLREADLPVFDTMIRRQIAFQKAALAGVIVSKAADPRALTGWQLYQDIAEEIYALGVQSK